MAINLTKDEKTTLAEHAALAWSTPGMIDYTVKSASAILTVRGRIITFGKPTIQTSFHFGEHGHDFDEVNAYASKMGENEMYFMMENLKWSPAGRILAQIEKARDYRHPAYFSLHPQYTAQPDDCLLSAIVYRVPQQLDWEKFLDEELTDQELDQIETVALAEQGKFEKRLMSYLKRYGLTKCNFSTYWADR